MSNPKMSLKTLILSICVILILFFLSVSAVIAQTPMSVSSLLEGLSVPGIDDLNLTGVTTGDGWTAGTTTLYGESITVVIFTQDGFDDKLVAVLPANATLSSFLPVGSGTVLDDVSLDDMAFVFVADGESGSAIETNSFPDPVSSVLTNFGDTVDLATGFNLFGKADFSASGAIQSVTSALGISQASLPLNGAFSKELLSVNPASMASALKDQILSNLNIVVPLPAASLGHNQLTLTNSQIAIVSKDEGIDFDITSHLSANLDGNTIAMDLDIDSVAASGGGFNLSVTGTSTESMTLNLFHSFDLTSLAFNASYADSAWTWNVDADSTLHGSPVDVSANSGGELTITTDMTLAALINEPSTPGLDDITLDSIVVKDSTIEVDTTIKGLGVDIFIYRPSAGASANVGIVATSEFTFSTFISQAAGTPLDDFEFDNIAFVWAPASNVATAIDSASLPGTLGQTINSSKASIDLKSGLNIFGSTTVNVGTGATAAWLSALNLPTTDSFLLDGTLSAQMFSPGQAAEAVETAILNALDFNLDLPAISLTEGPLDLSISNAHFAIRGDTSDGNKVKVDIDGDLAVNLDGNSIAMELAMSYEHGASPDLSISGTTTAPITFAFFNSFDIASGKFTAARTDNKWTSDVSGTAQLNGQNVDVKVDIKPEGDSAVFTTTSTLAALIGESNLPGLDDVTFNRVGIAKNSASVGGQFEGVGIEVTAFKRGPENKLHLAINFPYGNFKFLQFIPQLSDTGLPDISMNDATLLWVPEGSGETGVAISTLPSPFSDFLGTSTGATSVDLVPGVNVFGYLALPPGSSYDNFLGDLGVNGNGQYVRGVMPAAIFQARSSSATEEIKQAVLDNLNIHWAVPIPKIPGLDNILTFSDAKLVITGKQNAQGQTVIDAGVSGNADFHVKGDTFRLFVDIEDNRVSGPTGSNTLTFSASSTESWTHPMGIDWFVLDDIDLKITKTSSTAADSPSDYSVALNSTIEISGAPQEVTTKFIYAGGAITDASFTLDGPLELSAIPGLSDLPNASEFSISSLTVSSDGIEADTTLNKNSLDFYAFKQGGNWNFAAVQKNFKISELIPELDNTPAGDFQLSEAAVLVSDGGINGLLSSMPTVAQNALKNIYGNTSAEVKIASGLSIVAAFGSGGTNPMAKGMSRMGAGNGGVLIGTIGGVFGGTPDLALTMEMDVGAKPQHNTKMATIKDGEQLSLGISLTGDEGSFVGELNTTVDVTTTIHDDVLVFGSTVSLQLSEEDVRLEYLMSLKTGNLAGKPLVWHKPYGIPGLELHALTLGLGIDEDGAQHFAFAGDFTAAKDTVTFALDFDLTPEALEFPTDVGFKGTATELEMDFMEAVAFKMLSAEMQAQNVDLGMSTLPLPTIKGLPVPAQQAGETATASLVTLAFVTPGAQDPNVGLTSVGFSMKGSMHWLGKDLGDLSIVIGPTSGIFAWGDLADINLGDDLLTLKDNNFAMRVPIPGLSKINSAVEVSSNAACKSQSGLLFCLNSSIDVIGISDKVRVDVTSEGMSFSSSESFGKYFNETLQFALTGVDLTTSHPSLSNADFALSGTLKADIGDEIELLISDGITDVFNGLSAALKTGEADIKTDKAKVANLTAEINKQRAIMRAARQKVENVVNTAQQHVNNIEGEINHLWQKYHHCHGWGKYFCKARYGIEIGGEKAVKDVADGVLAAAKALVDHVPIDLSPTVWPLILSRDTADGTLYVAEESIKGLVDLDDWTTKGLDEIKKYVGGSVNIHKASFNGSLRGIIASNKPNGPAAPVDLAIDADILGTNFSDNFAFNIGILEDDVAADLKQLGLMAYYGIDRLFMHSLDDVPEVLKHQLRGAIGKVIDADQAANQRRLAANATDFAKYGRVAKQLQSTYADFADSWAFTQMTQVVSPLDRLPASKTFTDDVIEIGNTGYCISVPEGNADPGFDACAAIGQIGNGIQAGIGDQKLNTLAIMEAGKDSGYVAIQSIGASRGTSCLSIDGAWANKEVSYGTGPNSMSAYQSVFTPRGGDGVPSWASCATQDDQQNWKILDHGEQYFQIINRATQDCAYLKYGSNPNEDVATLAMISCIGANTQVYKLAPDDPPTHHLVGTVIKKAYSAAIDAGASMTTLDCITGNTNTGGWGDCTDNSLKTTQMEKSTEEGWNITWNYWEDFLSRRRFVASVHKYEDVGVSDRQEGQSICLDFTGSTTDSASAYPEFVGCDATEERQWLDYYKVVGGFTLASLNNSNNQGVGIVQSSRFPDPELILSMPLNPVAGGFWESSSNSNLTSQLRSSADAAYAATDQTNTAIASRVSHWAKIKSELDTNKTSLNEGKEHCIASSTLCYMTGPPSPYVAQTGAGSTASDTATANIPTGAVGLSGGMPAPGAAASSSNNAQGTTFAYLTNGTMIVSDDMSANSAASVAAYTGTPSAPVKWVVCRSMMNSESLDSSKFFIPGVVENLNCVHELGNKLSIGGQTEILKKTVDLFWQPSGWGYLPSTAVPTGRVPITVAGGIPTNSGPTDAPAQALFSCRSMINRTSYIGWTFEGEFCHLKYSGKTVVTRNFQVLTLNGSLAEPKPTPPQCTNEDVQNYMNEYQSENLFFGGGAKKQFFNSGNQRIPGTDDNAGFYDGNQYYCTPAQYNAQNPGNHYRNN